MIFLSERLNLEIVQVVHFHFHIHFVYKCPYVSFQRMFPRLSSSDADPLSINFYTYRVNWDIRILNPALSQITRRIASLF